MSKYKYTKEQLELVVSKNISVSDVMRELGIKISGGNHKHLTNSIRKFEIDTSHFTGRASAKGKASWNKKTWNEILVLKEKDTRSAAYQLRRSLIESGREYKCSSCGLKDDWNKKPIVLEIHHKNKNWLDNREENLDFLCPNCHSQEK